MSDVATATRLAGCAFVLTALAVTGCAGQKLRQRVDVAHVQLVQARDAGAYRCAPRALALGETHVEFATQELDQGDYFRARDHIEVAELNAREAARSIVTCQQPGAPGAASAGDADGDRIADADDRCPRDPEDRDGYQDGDGCPDVDNDNDGLADAQDKCSGQPEDKDGFEDDDGCPDLDNDQDGLGDLLDRCPRDPEDKDGFEDADGCPELDNDKDGVTDASDRCPNEAGPEATNGCPQKFSLITVTKDRIEIKQTIFFQTARAVIQPRSFALLEEVAAAIRSRPSMKVRIEGHTDSRGKRETNLRLSQQRADAVRAHLVGLGVAPERLESRGFGPEQPIETNKTAAGRDRNRRVEFVITQP